MMKVYQLVLLFSSYSVVAIDASTTNGNGGSLIWNISATTNDNKKTILDNIVGSAKQGKLHALMGPSGSGKSTLLNCLSGSVPSKSLKLSGEVLSPFEDKSPIFVQQEDLLFAQLSVKETLMTSAKLKSLQSNNNNHHSLNKKKNNQNIEQSVSDFILDLGLKKVMNNNVGDAKTRGISGGEKKRLSIGNELIGTAANMNNENVLIFCDEPTSGLDSYQAEKVMQLLKDMAKKGNTVIASIHQPRASIYAMFDEITIISEGKIIYTGSTSTMSSYFASIGYPCPNHINPAEYYIDLVSTDYSSPESEEESRQRILKLSQTFYLTQDFKQLKMDYMKNMNHNNNNMNKLSIQSTTTTNDFSLQKKNINIFRKMKRAIGNSFIAFKVLYIRAIRQVTRDKALNIARFMSNLFSSLLFGSIYFKMSNSASTVADRLGLLQVAAVNAAMLALIKATTTFVTEKLIVQRERRSGLYSVTPYLASKLLAEIPLSAVFPCMSGLIMYKLCGLNPAPGRLLKFLGILTVESMASTALGMSIGSLASTPESAVAIAPAVMVIFIVFGGLYVVNAPWYLKWVPNTSLIRWAYEALCINEFTDLKLIPKTKYGMGSVSTGEQVLENLGIKAGVNTIGSALKANGIIILANYLFTYLSLAIQRPSFEKIHTPVTPSERDKDISNDNDDDDEKDSKDGTTKVTASADTTVIKGLDHDDDDKDIAGTTSSSSSSIGSRSSGDKFKSNKKMTTTVPFPR